MKSIFTILFFALILILPINLLGQENDLSTPPQFKDGQEALSIFVNENLKSLSLVEASAQDTVSQMPSLEFSFIVNANGSLKGLDLWT